MSTAMPLPAPTEGLESSLPSVASRFEDMEIVVVETLHSIDEMMADLEAYWALDGKATLSLDCEATDKDPVTATPLLLQVAAHSGRVYVINLTLFKPSQIETLFRRAHEMGVVVMGHNLAYDYKLLRAHGYVSPGQVTRVYDTQLAELVLTTGHYNNKMLWLKSVSLKRLVEKYCGLQMEKDVRETFIQATSGEEAWVPDDAQVEYAAYDVATLFEIREAQVKALQKHALVYATKLRFDAVVPVVEMELRGMLIDQAAWRKFLDDVRTLRQVYEQRLVFELSPYEWLHRERVFFEKRRVLSLWEQERDLMLEQTKAAWEGSDKSIGWGEYKLATMKSWRELHPRPQNPGNEPDMSPINLGSSQQMLRALTALGLELENTGKEARLRAMRGDLTDEQRTVMNDYQEFSGLNRILVGFGENVLAMINPSTGRLHGRFNIHVAATGRWSSEHPNFQNFPRNDAIRHAFIADPDMVVVTADYSSQELAIVAALSRDLAMIRDYNAGKDLYKELASVVWKVPVEQVTKDMRQKAKIAMLGINYGLSATGLNKRQGIPLKEAEALIAGIKKKYPQVVAWGDAQAAKAFNTGYVETAAGTKRFFVDKTMPRWKFDTEGRNAPVQGSAADSAYRLIRRGEDNLVPHGILPVNFVHDEVVALAPVEAGDVAAERLCHEMEEAFYDLLPFEKYGVRIRVDAHVAAHWTKDPCACAACLTLNERIKSNGLR